MTGPTRRLLLSGLSAVPLIPLLGRTEQPMTLDEYRHRLTDRWGPQFTNGHLSAQDLHDAVKRDYLGLRDIFATPGSEATRRVAGGLMSLYSGLLASLYMKMGDERLAILAINECKFYGDRCNYPDGIALGFLREMSYRQYYGTAHEKFVAIMNGLGVMTSQGSPHIRTRLLFGLMEFYSEMKDPTTMKHTEMRARASLDTVPDYSGYGFVFQPESAWLSLATSHARMGLDDADELFQTAQENLPKANSGYLDTFTRLSYCEATAAKDPDYAANMALHTLEGVHDRTGTVDRVYWQKAAPIVDAFPHDRNGPPIRELRRLVARNT